MGQSKKIVTCFICWWAFHGLVAHAMKLVNELSEAVVQPVIEQEVYALSLTAETNNIAEALDELKNLHTSKPDHKPVVVCLVTDKINADTESVFGDVKSELQKIQGVKRSRYMEYNHRTVHEYTNVEKSIDGKVTVKSEKYLVSMIAGEQFMDKMWGEPKLLAVETRRANGEAHKSTTVSCGGSENDSEAAVLVLNEKNTGNPYPRGRKFWYCGLAFTYINGCDKSDRKGGLPMWIPKAMSAEGANVFKKIWSTLTDNPVKVGGAALAGAAIGAAGGAIGTQVKTGSPEIGWTVGGAALGSVILVLIVGCLIYFWQG